MIHPLPVSQPLQLFFVALGGEREVKERLERLNGKDLKGKRQQKRHSTWWAHIHS